MPTRNALSNEVPFTLGSSEVDGSFEDTFLVIDGKGRKALLSLYFALVYEVNTGNRLFHSCVLSCLAFE